MIGLLFVGLLAVVVFAQIKLAPTVLKNLFYEYKYDTRLAEPGELITFTSKMINAWNFPVVYVSVAEQMPETARIEKTGRNSKSHRLYLLPKHSYTHDIRFSIDKRGVYRKGKCYIEAGDFLGFTAKVRNIDLDSDIVIMPKRSEDDMVIKTLGGYIGDISVRRFIIEDPVLTIGYRDYTGREPMKNISWNQSARVNKLMVKNNDYTVDTNVAVVLHMDSDRNREMESCLEILRTVCEELEKKRIPYEFLSNGDMGDLNEGYGSRHLNYLMMKAGRSKLRGYFSFRELMDRCRKKKKNNRSYIVITPQLDEDERAALNRLQAYSDHEVCVFTGGQNDDQRIYSGNPER